MFKTTPLTIWLTPFQRTDLRERRANITEGQRQLVTIARAIPG
jgi:ABC-type methionine transport system ATPase subunit